MQLPNAEIQIHAVDSWYTDTKVYQFGSYEQQRSKLYRCLGEIAEGVQKDDTLKVAAGIGRVLWTFIGLVHFSKQAHDVPLHSQLDHYIQLKLKATNKHAQLHALMHNTLDLVWQTPEDGDFCLHSFLKAFGDFMMGLNTLCKATGLEFDRVVYNGHYALIRTQGEMNELGMFIPAPGDLDGDVMGQPLVNEKLPSGQLTHFYIESGLNAAAAKAFVPYVHTPFASHKVDEVSDKLAEALEELLERHIYSDDKWRHLTFERTPKINIMYENGTVTATYNDDLKFIMNTLKQDNLHHETISGLTA
ncbi:hypothetical protein STRATTON_251 [Erwinia phage vB_EamM_Stratton]|uniref:Uncharacterized protein n=2 Tax=Erskinevirus EaH2 TaxID=2169883 RepID=A0A1B2IHD2_9CAUD|nr:hypothetical protein G173_gp149 [Erwinia phage phiEaH2]AFQ96694.1 hypothetical protein [Erwinia phage phiEaH2]ANZ50676.1 hypothetical protein STRATTON_251 [Erwinia phage vB_EamM_Stratton]